MEREPERTEEVNGYEINIYQDSDPESPREWDNLGTMVCFHKRYDLGDQHPYNSGDYDGWNELKAAILDDHPGAIILPLYLYDHSGLSISTRSFVGRSHHGDWDSMSIGFIYVDRDAILEEYGWKVLTAARRLRIESYLNGEVDTYDQYLRGDVYGYEITDPAGEPVDSCWGYFGIEDTLLNARERIPTPIHAPADAAMDPAF